MSQRLDYNQIAPAGAKALGGVYGYVTSSGLPAVLVDLVYLRVSQINGCAFCLDMHTRDLLTKGQPIAKLALVQAWRESGFWRPGPGQDDVEIVLASNTGQALQYVGVAGDQRWDVHTISAVPTPTARPVDGERRLYAIVDGELAYVTELAPAGQPYAPHLNARLARVE